MPQCPIPDIGKQRQKVCFSAERIAPRFFCFVQGRPSEMQTPFDGNRTDRPRPNVSYIQSYSRFRACPRSAQSAAEIGPTDRAGTALAAQNASANRPNILLSSLPHAQFGLLSPYMVVEQLTQGSVLIEAGDETESVYFPHRGMLSLLAVLKDGRAIETATVGREGVVGAMAGFGVHISHVRVVVQLQAEVTRIPASRFRKATADSAILRSLCIGYNETLLSQARISVACNAVHVIEARFCRWLLQTADTAESNTINLTQHFLAEMLGVRRTSVTEVARKVQEAGAIHYSRGEIKILDRQILERMSCECYSMLAEQAKSVVR